MGFHLVIAEHVVSSLRPRDPNDPAQFAEGNSPVPDEIVGGPNTPRHSLRVGLLGEEFRLRAWSRFPQLLCNIHFRPNHVVAGART